ncbi:unnamed protein product [Vicia faba]|uniref:18S pre-ribosomal assembly protein gar2-related n=1 Tax=Vicia faba TaxID=3906 RepID=A0AAV0ZAB9_VICFA|nr:unnamed protein product [Vicia faba]
MKLESELSFRQMVVELESQSFEFNDSDQNSPSFRLQNQKAKEYDNSDSKNVKKTEQYDSIVDLKKGYDAQNPVDVHVNRTVAGCEPEMEVCYEENTYHVVKDICVDKGVFNKHKFMFEENVDRAGYNFFPLESFDDNRNPEDNTGIKVLNQPETDDSDEASSNHDQHKDDSEIEDLIDNFTKATDLREDTQDAVPTGGKDEQLSVEHDSHSQLKDANNMVEEEVLTSSALGSTVDEPNSDHHFAPSAPADCVKKELHQFGGCNCDETQLTTVEGSSGDISEIQQAETSQIHNSIGESSFSAAGAVSGRISYSGSIPYSGSISIRSDSSTTSTRSFAFPILQSEWNSSPVRMEKPDRRHYRKQRNWKASLLCCKF